MMPTKKLNEGVVTNISDSDLVTVCDSQGTIKPITFANLMAAIKGGIQIGGRNLIQGTSESYMDAPMTQFSWVSPLYPLSTLGLGDNETITLTVTVNNTSNCTVSLGFEIYNSEADRPTFESPVRLSPGGHKRMSVSGSTLQGYQKFRVRINNKSGISNQTVKVSAIKLERGNMATDWTPAPEDIASGAWGG